MHELVRQYGAAQLGQFLKNAMPIGARHAAYYTALVHGLVNVVGGFDAQGAVQSELDNIRTAWLLECYPNNLELLAMGLRACKAFIGWLGCTEVI
ncbi:MAG: hypothetical protein R3E79_51970 [Caldilineaceae bacterium]